MYISLRVVAGYELVKRGHECKSADEYLGTASSVSGCANLCRNNGDCTYFVLGNGGGEQECYWEKTALSTCPEGWDDDTYDFYKLKGNICNIYTYSSHLFVIFYGVKELVSIFTLKNIIQIMVIFRSIYKIRIETLQR